MRVPPPRDFGWALRHLKDAKSAFVQQSDGRIVMEVHHQIVPKVTTGMMSWWFGVYTHQKVVIEDQTKLAFCLWHPRDHIHIARVGAPVTTPLQPGDRLEIREAYGAEQIYKTQEVLRVMKRDREGYIVRAVRLGMTVAELEYCYEDTPEGLDVSCRLYIGVADGLLKTIVNQFLVPLLFDDDKTQAWMQHNVEEVGCFEHFLPALYARRDQGDIIRFDVPNVL